MSNKTSNTEKALIEKQKMEIAAIMDVDRDFNSIIKLLQLRKKIACHALYDTSDISQYNYQLAVDYINALNQEIKNNLGL